MERHISVREKCAYFGCTVTKEDNNNIPLHRFPTANSQRLEQWIENAGNPQLRNLQLTSLRKYGVCNKHFDDDSFTNSSKKRVNWNAIPKPNQNSSHSAGSSDQTVSGDTKNSADQALTMENYQTCSLSSRTNPAKKMRIESLNVEEDITELENDLREDTGKKTIEKTTTKESGNASGSFPSPQMHSQNICCGKWVAENGRLEKEKRKFYDQNQELIAENNKLHTQVINMKAEMRNLKYAVSKIPEKIAKAKQTVTLEEFLHNHEIPLKPVAETMVKLQLRKPHTPYTEEEKDLSKQFFYHSHAAYTRMRDAGLNLPAESTVRRWISQIDIQPGFNDSIFNTLEQKMKAVPADERLCALAWDEMSIKEYQEYSPKYDLIEGLVDLGPLGRKDESAKYVFSFNLTSLNSDPLKRWRQPLAYLLSGKGGMTADQIDQLTRICLDKLEKVGVDVRLLVCDQGVNNQQTFNKWKINVDNPKWVYNGKTYYVSYDFPHLIKRVLAMLRTHGAIYNDDGHCLVAWKDFRFAKEYDLSSSSSHLLDHITQVHLNPNGFQAMNVKRAFQIFGKRYADAIKLAGESVERTMQSEVQLSGVKKNQMSFSITWRDSAEFAAKMNDIIDACNAPGLKARNPNNRPLSQNNPQIEQNILEMINWVPTWRVKKSITQKNIQDKDQTQWTIPPCFYGLRTTGNALLSVYHTVSGELPSFEFATARGNQDGNEHWNALLRARNGPCSNPTARMVRLTARHVLSVGMIHIGDKTNVECKDSDYVTSPKSTSISKEFHKLPVQEIPDTDENSNFHESEEIGEIMESLNGVNATSMNEYIEYFEKSKQAEKSKQGNIAKNSQYSFYETNAITYFAGYVAFKILSSVKCDRCRTVMVKTPMEDRNDDELYIEYREYENPDIDAPPVTKLQRPTSKFAWIVALQLRTFERTCRNHWAKPQLRENIVREITNDLNTFEPTWFQESHPCYKHRLEATQFMVKVKLFSHCKSRNRQAAANRIAVYSRNKQMKNVTNQ